MKALRILFYLLAVLALIGVVTGHFWHAGTLAVCLIVAVTTKEDEEKTGRG